MTDYRAYQPKQSTQDYGVSYSENITAYAIAAPKPRKKGKCPSGGKCVVCSRMCMM